MKRVDLKEKARKIMGMGRRVRVGLSLGWAYIQGGPAAVVRVLATH